MIKAYKYTCYSLPLDIHNPCYDATEIFIPDYELIVYGFDEIHPFVISGTSPRDSYQGKPAENLIEIEMPLEDANLFRELGRIQKELSRLKKKYC